MKGNEFTAGQLKWIAAAFMLLDHTYKVFLPWILKGFDSIFGITEPAGYIIIMLFFSSTTSSFLLSCARNPVGIPGTGENTSEIFFSLACSPKFPTSSCWILFMKGPWRYAGDFITLWSPYFWGHCLALVMNGCGGEWEPGSPLYLCFSVLVRLIF